VKVPARSCAHQPGVQIQDLDTDPLRQLHRWIDDAAAAGIGEPASMCLATADLQARPSARIVLLRGLDDRGLRFFTSYGSRKALELAANPYAAVAFHWPSLERQVRVEGSVEMLSEEESDEYFASRPRGHQLAAWACEQSEPIESREIMETRFAHFEARFADDEAVPRPHSWGGYLLGPLRFEFWQGRPNRMHDRFEYIRDGAAWRVSRLQP
jgi:pyridoxamine 5'-phosphate oxidase